MTSLLYFAIIAIQYSSSLATNDIPLKCYLKNNGVLNLFSASIFPSLTHVPEFETVKAEPVGFNKDEWSYSASDFEYEGLKDSIVDDFGFNFETKIVRITFHTDLFLKGRYKTDGKLLSMPIVGEGIAKVNLANVHFGIIMPFDIIEEKGNKFIQLHSFSSWFDVRDNVSFELTNLYNGDEVKRTKMLNLMNQNWKYVVSRYGEVFMDKIAERVFNALKSNMLNVPVRDFTTC